MPGENEIKLVLFFSFSEDMPENAGWRFKAIPRQGYIPPGASIHKENNQSTFRYKLHIPEKNKDIVLEKAISDDDYQELLKKADSNGVLSKQGRVREYGEKFMFTYKEWSQKRNCDTEIEMKISEEDFEDLFAQNEGYLTKNRYYDPENDNSDHQWSVDFLFDDDGSPYCILAEVEMPEGQNEPDYTPDLINGHIAYLVPKGDKNFSNKMLADQQHAKKMLEQIGVISSDGSAYEI